MLDTLKILKSFSLHNVFRNSVLHSAFGYFEYWHSIDHDFSTHPEISEIPFDETFLCFFRIYFDTFFLTDQKKNATRFKKCIIVSQRGNVRHLKQHEKSHNDTTSLVKFVLKSSEISVK